MTLYEYFDRIAIIHLPDRRDRFQALSVELREIGIDIGQPKVQIPHATVPTDWSGWPSRGVYGNFLSHLGILRQALQDGLQTVGSWRMTPFSVVVALVYNPALSIQKGSPSSPNNPKWFDILAVTRRLVSLARRARDHWWRLKA
jgi:hypothetical protein